MITQMLAANGFLDGIVSSRARTGMQGKVPVQNLFSLLLTKAGSSLGEQATAVTRVQTQKVGYMDQLKDKLIRSGATLEEITLEPEAENHLRALLLLDGYSPDQVEEIMAGFGEEGMGMTGSVLFSRIAQLKPEDAVLQQSRTLEVSAIPHLEKALFLAGLNAEQSQDVINGSLTSTGKVSLEKLVQNLQQVLGDEEQNETGVDTALGILEALDQAGLAVGDQETIPTTLTDVLRILESNASEDTPGLPGISRARLISHLNGVVDNAVVEEETGDGLVPLSKLIESKLKFVDEQDFEDVPVVYVEMALRRMGLDSAEAGRLAAQVVSGGLGKGRVLVNNLSVAEKFKESLPQESVPVFERLIQEMAKTGKLNKTELSVLDFSEVFASMDLEKAMEGLDLQGSDELENLAALLTHSLQTEEETGAQTASYLDKISVPQTLVELRDLLLGLAKSGKNLPEAAAKDLAEVLKQARAEPTLVDDLIAEAKIAGEKVDPAKLAKSMEKVAQSVLILATEEADARIETEYKAAELSRKFAGVMQVLQNTRSGFLSEDATQYIAKVLEDMGIETHEITQALSQNRFPGRGVDPVPVIEVVKKIAERMGIDSASITEASIRTGIQDPDAAVARVESKGQTFAFADQETTGQNKNAALASHKGMQGSVGKTGLENSTSPTAQADFSQDDNATLTLDESEEPVITMGKRAAKSDQAGQADSVSRQTAVIPEAEDDANITGDVKVARKNIQAESTQVSDNGAKLAQGPVKTSEGMEADARVQTAPVGKITRETAIKADSNTHAQSVESHLKIDAEGTKLSEAAPQSSAQSAAKPQVQSKTETVPAQPEMVVRGAERVHHQAAASEGNSQTVKSAQVKTVENVQVENRDGQRVQVRSSDVYVQGPAGVDGANTWEDLPGKAAVQGREPLRAGLGAAQANRDFQRTAKEQVSPHGQKTAEAGETILNNQEKPAATMDSEFAETLENAATRKADAAFPVRSKDGETNLDAKEKVRVAMTMEKASVTAETQTTEGKGASVAQSTETQGNVQSFRQELSQAARTEDGNTQRPVLRPYEGQMGQQLGGQVVQALNRQENRIRLQLHPKQLGAVDVHLNLRKNMLSIGMSAETEAVKEILLSQVAELKTSLSEQGIVVDKIEVNVRQNPEQNLAQQQQGRGQGQQPGGRGSQGQGTESNPEGFVGLTPPRYQTDSGLDLMA